MRMAIIKKSGGGGGGAVGTAKPPDVLAGKTFSSNDGTGLVGTMPNQGKKDFTPGKTPQTIPAGYHNGQGEIDSLGGDAEKGDVLIGKTFSSDIEGRAVNGTMPDQGAKIITPTRTGVIIPAGYHNGQGVVVGDTNFVAGNIKDGVEIWGVVGTMTPYSPPVGNALPAHVLAGKTFESAAAGTGAIGTMVDRGAVTITPGSNNKSIPAGYHNGAGYVQGDSNLISDNIVEGISIFGVTGSAKKVISGSFSIRNEFINIEIGFRPRCVLCSLDDPPYWALRFMNQNSVYQDAYANASFKILNILSTGFRIEQTGDNDMHYGIYWAFGD